MTQGSSGLSGADIGVLVGYFVLVILIGVFVSIPSFCIQNSDRYGDFVSVVCNRVIDLFCYCFGFERDLL